MQIMSLSLSTTAVAALTIAPANISVLKHDCFGWFIVVLIAFGRF
jgi:hypothetical protein